MPPSEFNPIKKPAVRTGLWSVLVIVVIIALVAILLLAGVIKSGPTTLPAPIVEKANKIVVTAGVPEGFKSTTVSAGELPKDFPKQIILPASAKPFRSADITFGGVNQKIVEFMSSSTPDQVAALYKKTLPTLSPKKWELKSETQAGTATLLTFSNGNDLEVLIVPTSSGSQVKLTYYVKI